MAVEELGPAWIKFGQILSNRPGLLPDALTEELTRLQDKVAPMAPEEVNRVIADSFGRPVAEIFQHFNPEPIGSASIAQVHIARLHNGEQVAVKIQRPGIEAMIRGDLILMRDLAALMNRSGDYAKLRPVQLVEVFEKSILEELDFLAEQGHLLWFAEKFRDEKNIKIPAVYQEYSTSKVITLEYLEGVNIRETDKLRELNCDLAFIARKGFEAYARQIFEWGYFHADPHPGNLLILPGNVIGILDFGMVGRLNDRDRKALTEFIIGLGKDDIGRIVENIERLQAKDVENRRELEKDIIRFIQDFGSKAIKDIDLNEVLKRGRELIFKHNLELNPDLFLMLRTVSLLEGIGMSLDTSFRSLDMVKPYAFDLLRRSINPFRLAKSKTAQAWLADFGHLAYALPGDFRRILEKLRNDQLQIQTESKSTRLLAREVAKAGRRIAYAILSMGFLAGALYTDHSLYAAGLFSLSAISLLAVLFVRRG